MCVFQIPAEAASSDSTKSKTTNKKSSNETEEGPRKHENHQLEVEVMLYRFKRPVAEVSCFGREGGRGVLLIFFDKIILSKEALASLVM